MTERRKFSLKYGSEISLLYEEETGFLSCPGGAHPKLALRPGHQLVDLLSFENCVFVVHPPIDVTSANSASNSVGSVADALGAGAGGVGGHTSGSLHATVSGGGVSGSGPKQYVLQTEVTYGAKFLLKHKQSGLFVSILTTQPSELDSDCHMVALIAENEAAQTRSALFRFTPRFKVHNEGDFVCQGDSVLLQTFSHKLFLHVSELATTLVTAGGEGPSRAGSTVTGAARGAGATRGPIGSPSTPSLNLPTAAHHQITPRSPSMQPAHTIGQLMHHFEVNGSEVISPWIVHRYDSGLDHIDCQKVAAKGKPLVLLGTPVALFHRERESLLTSSVARPLGATRSESSNSATPPGTRAQTVLRYKSGGARSSSTNSFEPRRRGYQSMASSPPVHDNNSATSWRSPSPTTGASRIASMAPSAFSADSIFANASPMVAAGDLGGLSGTGHTVSPTSGADRRSPRLDLNNTSTTAMKNSNSGGGGRFQATVTPPSGVYPLLSPYTNGYLSNEFSFATLRCSCAAYWVFEQVDPTVGGPLRYGVPFRLRQAATNMYLAVVGNSMEAMMSAQWQAPSVSGAFSTGSPVPTSLSQRGIGRKQTSGGSMRFRQNSSNSDGIRNGDSTLEFALALVPAPADEEMQQRTLFMVEHTFYPEAKVVSETDFFRIQHVETGLWLCTDSDVASRSEVTLSLEFRPLAHDAFMTGHISEQAHRDVLHIFYNFDALQRYKNLFSAWWHQRTSIGANSLESAEGEAFAAGDKRTTPPGLLPSASTVSLTNASFSGGASFAKSTASFNNTSAAFSSDFDAEGLPPTSKSAAAATATGVGTFSTRNNVGVIRRCSEALTSLIAFCTASDDPDPLTREGLPIPDHQRMMFDLQLHRMVFDIIVAPLVPVTDPPRHQTIIDLGQSAHRLPKLPLQGGAVPKKQFDVKHPEFGVLHNISRLGFRLIKQMVMGNPSFAALLAKYIPVMFELDGMKLHVVEVMHEIFTENDELPSVTIESAVDHYVKTLVTKQRSAGYLKFLATMCALRNNTCGLVENQELVCRKLIIERPKDQPVLLPTVLLPSGHVGVEYSSQEPAVSIERFLTNHKDSKLVKFFEGQIELFAKLSCGCGSKMCAKALEAHFPSLQLDGVVKTILWTGDEVAGKPSKLDLTRCNLFRLAMNLYVHPVLRNSEVQLALNTILIGTSTLRRKWDARRHDVSVSHSSTKDTVIMSSIKHAAMQLLQANPYIVLTDRPRNELIKTVLDVWCDFVIYRQYSTDELRTLLPLVVRLLDGTRDVANAVNRTGSGGGLGASANNVSSASFMRHGSNSQLRRSASVAAPHMRNGPNANSLPSAPNTFRVDPRRFLKTEDSFLVMEIRLSICQLLSSILRNMIHDEGDEIIVEVFNALGGVQAVGGGTGGGSGGSKSLDSTNQGAGSSTESGRRAPSFPGIFRRVASAFGLAKEATDAVVLQSDDDDGEDETASTAAHHRVTATVTLETASSVTDVLIQNKVRLISACFNPEELVPIILDTAQYNHPQLTTVSMNLLVDLCSIRRKLCENVLSVKLVPSREMLSQFDRLHGVAVEISTAVESGEVEEIVDAMEMVLKTLLNNYVPRNRLRHIGSTLGTLSGGPAAFGSMRSSSPNASRDGSLSSATDTPSGPRERSNSGRRRSVKFADGSDDEGERSPDPTSPNSKPGDATAAAAAPAATKAPRTAKIRWAEATTVAKLVAMSKRVQRKRNSLGLDPSSDVPLDVICRAELMCHWGIHLTLLDKLANGELTPAHPAYVDVMDFFYYFSLSPSNARQLSAYLELFITAIHNEDVRMQCMHVVVAVLSARALRATQGKTSNSSGDVDSGGAGGGNDGGIEGKNVDVGVLQSLASMIHQEHQSREPDSSFLRLCNKHLLGDYRVSDSGGAGGGNNGSSQQQTAALSQTSSKQFVHLLHAKNVFQNLADPKGTRAAELQFNSSLVELLCGICRSNRSVRSLAQRIVTQAQLLATLSRKSRAEMLPRVHQCPYYRLLTEVFFSRDEESETERVKIMTLWNESSSWWSLVKHIGRQYSDVAVLQQKAATNGMRMHDAGASVDEIIAEQSDEQKEAGAAKDFWFQAVPAALTSFLVTTFSVHCMGVHRSEVIDALKDLASGLGAFSKELTTSAGLFTGTMSVNDVVSIARCMRATEDAMEALSGDYYVIDRSRQYRRYELQMLVEDLNKAAAMTNPNDSSGGLRRGGSGSSGAPSTNADGAASQYGNGSFFFQSDVRDMSELEVIVRRVFAKSAPRDVIISKHLLKSSDAAQCFVKYLTAMATPAVEVSKDTQLVISRKTPLSKSLPSTAASQEDYGKADELQSNSEGLKVTRRTMESFVLKLLAHLGGLSLPADTISGILNLLHATLVGVDLPDEDMTAVLGGSAASLLSQQPGHDSFGRRSSEPGIAASVGSAADGLLSPQSTSASPGSTSGLAVAAMTSKSDVITAELEHRRLVARQNHFDQLGLMRVVTGLSDLSDPTVTKSALEVGIALLEEGNTQVQNHMLQYFETHDESFFHNVKEILQSCMERVQGYNEWLLQHLLEKGGANASIGLEFYPTAVGGSMAGSSGGRSASSASPGLTTRQRSMLSLTSFISSPSAGDGSLNRSPTGLSPKNALQSATPRYPGANPFLYIAETFRFLQLMCEGHHQGMQNYIRVQSDNLHSINVLQEVLLLIVELTAIRVDNSNVTVLRKGLELLTEFCQGPCVENQSTLLQNDICSLLSMILQLQPQDEDFAHSTSSGSGTVSPGDGSFSTAVIEREKLMELQHAASVTLLALTEGSSRPEVFQKVLSQIPLSIVERLVKTIVTSSSAAAPDSPQAGSLKAPSALVRKDSSSSAKANSVAEAAGTAEGDDDDDSSSSSNEDDAERDGEEEMGPTEDLLFNLLIFTKSVTGFLERSHDHAALEYARQVFSYVPKVAKRLGSIQVERNGVVERVYFPIPEICLSLTQKSKDDVLWTVDRTSRLTKLNDFFQKIDELMFEMNSVHRFARRVESLTRFNLSTGDGAAPSGPAASQDSQAGGWGGSGKDTSGRPTVRLTVKDRAKQFWNDTVCRYACRSDPEYYEHVALVLAVVINLLFVLTDGVDQEEHNTTAIEWFVWGLCALQAVLYAVVLVMDTMVFLPVYYYRGYRRQLRAAGIVVSTQRVSQDDVMRSMPRLRQRVLIAMHRFTTTYYLALFVASLCALFIDPYFAAIHLLGLINKSASLRTVIVAITQNGKSLLLTMGLGVIVVYLFSIVGYMYFPSAFGGGDEATSTLISENCQTLGRCFMFILTNGLRQGGGVGDLMDKASWESPMLFHRMGYDFAFYALVNVVFLNILFGIIIDTFAELRDDKRRKEEDMNTCCFICGLDAEVFEKEGGGFKRHVHRDHNMWQYLYFIYYLRLKDPNEFNGQESFVYREMMRGSLGFLPDGKCLSLTSKFGDGITDGSEVTPASAAANGKPPEDTDDTAQSASLGKGSGGQNSLTAALAGSLASAMKVDLDALREHLSTALKDFGTEVSQLRTAAAAVGGSGGALPDLIASSTAPTFGSDHPYLAQLRSGSPAGALNRAQGGNARRRSKSVGGPNPFAALDSSVNDIQINQDLLEHTLDGDAAVTALHAQIANLQHDLEAEKSRAAALQIQLFEARNAVHVAEQERDDLALDIRQMLERTLTVGSPSHANKPTPEDVHQANFQSPHLLAADPTSTFDPAHLPLSPMAPAATANAVADHLSASTTLTAKELLRSLSTSIEGLMRDHQSLVCSPMTGTKTAIGSPRQSLLKKSNAQQQLLFQLEDVPLEKSMHVRPAERSPPTATDDEADVSPSNATDEHVSPSPPSKAVSFRIDRVSNMSIASTTGTSVAFGAKDGGDASYGDLRRLASMSAVSLGTPMNNTISNVTAVSTSRSVQTSGTESTDISSPRRVAGSTGATSSRAAVSALQATLSPADDDLEGWTPSGSVLVSQVASRTDFAARNNNTIQSYQPSLTIVERVETATQTDMPTIAAAAAHKDAETQADDDDRSELATNHMILRLEHRKLKEQATKYYNDCLSYARFTTFFQNDRQAAARREARLRAQLREVEEDRVAYCKQKLWEFVDALKANGTLPADMT